jgi:hypothetical protein
MTEEDCFSSLEAIWYRDIEPRISPPLQGSLTGLIFDGVDPDISGAGLSASNTADQVSELRTCITDGLKTIKTSSPHGLAFGLSSKYPVDTLRLSLLSGQDHSKFQVLQNACENLPCTVLLANVKRTVRGLNTNSMSSALSTNKQYYIGSVEEDHSEITHVIDSTDNVVSIQADFDQAWFVQENIYGQARAPEAENLAQRAGAQDYQIVHTFHDSVSMANLGSSPLTQIGHIGGQPSRFTRYSLQSK